MSSWSLRSLGGHFKVATFKERKLKVTYSDTYIDDSLRQSSLRGHLLPLKIINLTEVIEDLPLLFLSVFRISTGGRFIDPG